MAQTFSAQVDAWVRKSERRIEAVFREGTQRVIERAQLPRSQGGNMRIDTGFLRASGQASLTAMPVIDRASNPAPGGSYSYSTSEIALVIASADLGDTIYFGYTASYAAHREFGARGQAPDAFVRSAAQEWQRIITQVAMEARQRVP